MTSSISIASDDSDDFYVEQSSNEPSPQRHNTPNILNSTETSEQHATRMPSISSISSREQRIFTIDDDSNEPYDAIWIWTAAPKCSPKSERLEPVAQPF